MLVISLLLLLSLASALLFLALGSSDIGSLHELSNRAFLLFLVLELHGLPHLVNFALTSALCLLFHVRLLMLGLPLQVVLLESMVIIAHHLPLTPFLETRLVVLGLVPSQEVLKSADILETEVVEAEFKIDQAVVLVEAVNEHAADAFIELVVADVQAE